MISSTLTLLIRRIVLRWRCALRPSEIRDYDLVFDPLGHRYAARTLNSGVLRRDGHYIHIAGSDWPPKNPGRFIAEASPLRLASNLTRQWWRNTTTHLGVGNSYYHLIFVHPSGRILQDVARHVDHGASKSEDIRTPCFKGAGGLCGQSGRSKARVSTASKELCRVAPQIFRRRICDAAMQRDHRSERRCRQQTSESRTYG